MPNFVHLHVHSEFSLLDGANEGISTGHIEMIKNLLNDNEITLETAIRRLTMLNCKLEKNKNKRLWN